MYCRVPFRSLVVGLLSHQLLLQTVGAILLEGTSNVATAEQHILQRNVSIDSDDLEAKDQGLPGIPLVLSHMLGTWSKNYWVDCEKV
jgi:hypothetical protein